MSECLCTLTLNNTGKPGCQKLADITKMSYYVPTFASDGTRNSIDTVNDTLDEAYVIAKLNESDPTKRWYPVVGYKNVEDVRAESNTEALNDGIALITSPGARTFAAILLEDGPRYQKKLNGFKCIDMSVYHGDKVSSLIGSKDGDYFYPIRIENGTFDVIQVKAADGARPKLAITFTYSDLELDENLDIIPRSKFDNYNHLSSTGLLDVNVEITSTTTTQMVFDLTSDFGDAINNDSVTGFELADVDSLFNITTGLPVIPSLITEDPTGTYALDYPAQTLADVLRLTLKKDGYEVEVKSDTVA